MTREGARDGRRLLVEAPAPRMSVARGFAVSGDAEELLRRFESEPHTERVDLGAHAHGLRIHRWRLDPAVAEVTARNIVDVQGDAAVTPAGSYLLDSRRAEVLLRFRDRGQRLELSLVHGHVAVFSLELRRADLPAFETLVATGGVAPNEWLAAHLADLEDAEDGVATVAAAGALVRFFGPHPDDAPSLGPPVVVRGARAWARSLSDDDWASLEGSALNRAKELNAHLLDDEADVVELARRRDLLQSFALTARLAGRPDSLGEALAEVDERAQAELTRLTERCETSNDPRLRVVAWSEPEAWWGAIAR